MRSGSQDCGSSRARIALGFAGIEQRHDGRVALAVGTIATGAGMSPRRASSVGDRGLARRPSACAAVQPLSTNSTSGPRPQCFGRSAEQRFRQRDDHDARPPAGATAAATMACAPAFPRRFSPSSSRSGGKTTRRGAGGVTRNSHQMTGSTTSAAKHPGRAETQIREKRTHAGALSQRCCVRDRR